MYRKPKYVWLNLLKGIETYIIVTEINTWSTFYWKKKEKIGTYLGEIS